jgi:hypothetical protein
MSLVTIPTPSLPSVPGSALLAWHIRALRRWDIPCDEPEALATGRVEWSEATPRIDVCALDWTPAKRVLFLVQAGHEGVVFGFFANCPFSGEMGGRDPALKSAIYMLEHPTGEQRKWQLQNPNYAITVTERRLLFGAGFWVSANGWLYSGRAPEFGLTEVDASFICLRPTDNRGWSRTQIIRWELWSV